MPVVVGGESLIGDREIVKQKDPSQSNVFCGQYTRAGAEDLQRAVDVAVKDPDGWRKLSVDERNKILSNVAIQVRKKTGRPHRGGFRRGWKSFYRNRC